MVVNNKGMPCINLTEDEKKELWKIMNLIKVECEFNIPNYSEKPKYKLVKKVIDKLC